MPINTSTTVAITTALGRPNKNHPPKNAITETSDILGQFNDIFNTMFTSLAVELSQSSPSSFS
jgi:hypothetical protein